MLSDRRTEVRHDTSAIGAERSPGGVEQRTSGPRDGLRRSWWHALALLVVMIAMAVVVDNGASGITDEGAVVAQVAAAADGDWWVAAPLPDIDPAVDFPTMEGSRVRDGAYLPYAAHPAYPALLIPFWNLGGHLGLLIASALGAWGAAVTGMFLTRRLAGAAADPDSATRVDGLGLVALWGLGLLSPLVFDATVVMAHGIAAALTGCIALALIAAVGATRSPVPDAFGARIARIARTARTARPDRARSLIAAAVAVALVLPLVLLRSEGVLVAGGFAVALGLTSFESLRPLRIRVDRFLLAGAVAVTGAAAYLLDGWWASNLSELSSVQTFARDPAADGFVTERSQALWASILRPGDPTLGPPAMLVGLAMLAFVAAAVMLRVSPRRRDLVVQLVVLGAALSVVRFFFPPGHVTGLLPAFPLLLAGLVQLRRRDLSSFTARLVAIASAVLVFAVWMTSYPIGGAAEWGGRYYHVVLPLLVPLAVIGLGRAWTALGSPSRGVAAACLVVAAVALTGVSIRNNIEMRQGSADVVEATLQVAFDAAPPADGGSPIVVTGGNGMGRVAWDHLDELRIARAGDGRLAELLALLADAQVDSVVLSVHHSEDIGPEVLGEWHIAEDRSGPDAGWLFIELRQ